MAAGAGQNRTEKATPRRRERARREGDVAYSSELTSAAGLVALAVIVDSGGQQWAAGLGRGMLQVAATCGLNDWTIGHTAVTARWMAYQLLAASGVVAISVLGFTMVAGALQSGFRLTATPLKINWARLDMTEGWMRLWSTDSLVKALGMMLKLVLVTFVAGYAALQKIELLRLSPLRTFDQTAGAGGELLSRVLWAAAAGALSIGLADIAWQRWRREKRLKMSKEELKQEQKEDGGDPQVKARMRKMQREATKRRGFKDIPQATVVLTNPTHFAVALKYDRASPAPKVVAKGTGPLAKMIIRLAKKHNVPVLERKPLARALYRHVEVGKEIPSEFYQAVAEILAFLYRQKRAG
jgi:flagellar biosynthetic protein FlhB